MNWPAKSISPFQCVSRRSKKPLRSLPRIEPPGSPLNQTRVKQTKAPMDTLLMTRLFIGLCSQQIDSRTTPFRAVWVVVSILFFVGCASPYAEVAHKQPRLSGPPGLGLLAYAE